MPCLEVEGLADELAAGAYWIQSMLGRHDEDAIPEVLPPAIRS